MLYKYFIKSKIWPFVHEETDIELKVVDDNSFQLSVDQASLGATQVIRILSLSHLEIHGVTVINAFKNVYRIRHLVVPFFCLRDLVVMMKPSVFYYYYYLRRRYCLKIRFGVDHFIENNIDYRVSFQQRNYSKTMQIIWARVKCQRNLS